MSHLASQLADTINREVQRRLEEQTQPPAPVVAMGSRGAHPDVFADVLQRLDHLSQRLTEKEREISALTAQKTFLDNDLQRTRDELEREATKAALLEQRANKLASENQQLAQQVHVLATENDSKDKTLSLVQADFSASKQDLQDKTRELVELKAYYSSMLEAKEASIHSLQRMFEAQQKTHAEQQEIWEDQRRSESTWNISICCSSTLEAMDL